MITAAERLVSAAGRRRVVTNAAIDAVQFYSHLDMRKRIGTIQVKALWNRSFRCGNS
jgi:hypothetical protein